MFQVLPALPGKQDNEFNQPLISGAISSPEEMEIVGFFPILIPALIGRVVACWQLAFFGDFLVFFFVVAVWAVGGWQEFEARVTLGALGCEIFGKREQGELTLSC